MSVDMFMKVEGASGESQDSNHKGWTDIDSFTWGATQPNTMSSGGGAGAGKVSFHDLNVIAKVDKCYPAVLRSEEHTSELQSQSKLVCRLLLEKKKNTKHTRNRDLRTPTGRHPVELPHRRNGRTDSSRLKCSSVAGGSMAQVGERRRSCDKRRT